MIERHTLSEREPSKAKASIAPSASTRPARRAIDGERIETMIQLCPTQEASFRAEWSLNCRAFYTTTSAMLHSSSLHVRQKGLRHGECSHRTCKGAMCRIVWKQCLIRGQHGQEDQNATHEIARQRWDVHAVDTVRHSTRRATGVVTAAGCMIRTRPRRTPFLSG